jgi:preprotein translocase subunit SecG
MGDAKLMEFAMLSFIRENGHGEPSGQEPPRPQQVGGTPADGAGELNRNQTQEPRLETREEIQGQKDPKPQENASGTQQEYLTVTARDKKNVRRSTILLAGLFILGLLCLWFMIKKSSPQTAAASPGKVGTEEAQIEAAIAQLTGVRSEMFNRMDEIVKKFYEFSDVQQVKVDELVKNPFKHEILLGNLKEKSDTEKGNLGTNAEEQLRQRTKDMQLLSIVATDKGKCCVIDDKRLYEGDSIRGFNVRQIGDRTVLLESNGVEIILKLSE